MKCNVCSSPLFEQKKSYCSPRCKAYKRPFRLWDGEGHNFCCDLIECVCDKPDHRLTLLANSDGEYIENEQGLSSVECLRFLLSERSKAYDCWFSFGYDVNKILADVPLRPVGFPKKWRHSLFALWKNGYTYWKGVRIAYIPRKFFQLSRRRQGSFHSYDTFGFFQTSFVKACKDWGLDPSGIASMKDERGAFAKKTAKQIRDYNFEEMALGLEMLNRLRDALYDCDLLPYSWHGPGAVAARWLQKNKIGEHYGTEPNEMAKAIRHAYFGGRIDVSLLGETMVHKHDISSAYPAGLADCISLRDVLWQHSSDCSKDDKHALYRVLWRIPRHSAWGVLPWRTNKGVVLFPYEGEGWYWGVELLAAERLYAKCFERIEAWYPEGQTTYPFREPITRDYNERNRRKKAGHASANGLKLALNSIYGRTCQHLARNGKPRWQNYIWAGYTTAFTRARIIDAMTEVGVENVIGIATDGLFAKKKLQETYGKGDAPLGGWEYEGEGILLVVAPGLYATYDATGKPTVYKSRGLPASVNFGFVLRKWRCNTKLNTEGANAMGASMHSFIGMGKALQSSKVTHGTFRTEERVLRDVTLWGTSKRFPNPVFLTGNKKWAQFPLLPKPRPKGETLSHPYKWQPELYDPREEKE